MITSRETRAAIGKVLALGFLLVTTVLSTTPPAGAAEPAGRAFAWGDNVYGQLGNANTGTDSDVPVAVKNLTGVKSVKAGCDHGLALRNNGAVWAWGYNQFGQLGNGTHGDGTNRSTPGNVVGLTNVRSISGGGGHSLAILESGRARSWGDNYDGQLGNGTYGDGTESDVPVAVKNLTNVKNIDGGFYFTLAATQ